MEIMVFSLLNYCFIRNFLIEAGVKLLKHAACNNDNHADSFLPSDFIAEKQYAG